MTSNFEIHCTRAVVEIGPVRVDCVSRKRLNHGMRTAGG